MVSACSKLVQDVPPFMLADGSPAAVRSINKIGLERSGFTKSEIELAKNVFKIFYRHNFNRMQAITHLKDVMKIDSEKIVEEIIKFFIESDRGIA